MTTPPTLESLAARVAELEAAVQKQPEPGVADAIRGLLSSKKVLTALGTVIAMAAGKLGLHIDDEQSILLASIGVSLILGFAAQDLGKEKAKIEAKSQS